MAARDLMVASGDEALKERPKTKKVRFVKAGESFRGRFLTLTFDKYLQHGDFEKKVQSHACIDPRNRTACPSCQANVSRKPKTLVWWWDIDKSEIVVRDVAESNLEGIRQALTDYERDSLQVDTFSIKISDKGAIGVSFLPPKKNETFPPTPEGIEIDDGTLDYVMNVRDEAGIRDLIAHVVGGATAPASEEQKKDDKDQF